MFLDSDRNLMPQLYAIISAGEISVYPDGESLF